MGHTEPNEPAFPGPDSSGYSGMTMREHLAALAMQGLLAAPERFGPSECAELAVGYADALLARLDMPREE